MKVAFSTLGCRVNMFETEAMTEKFLREGYELVSYDEFSDVYVINTCTVTSMGDKKSRKMIGRARRQNANAIIAIVGCYSQMAWEQLKDIPGVNVILGTKNKGEIVYWVNKAISEKKQVISIKEVLKDKNFEDLNIEEFTDKNRAFIKIQDGCNKFCSYCLIPYARGATCSKSPESVILEAEHLANKGYKEIILSGIHTSAYGVDFNYKYNLLDLIKELGKIEEIKRIRIGSLDPEFFTDENILILKELHKLCPHFHISLQSGSDETLKRMNRHYTTKFYEEALIKLRASIENVSVTTDIIVGFPGESLEEFKATYNYLEKLKLTKMHVFKYSSRAGTRAEKFENQITPEIKEERSSLIIKLSDELEKDFLEKYISTTMDVLFEQEIDKENNIYSGYSTNFITIYAKSERNIIDEILPVKLIKNYNTHILGDIQDK